MLPKLPSKYFCYGKNKITIIRNRTLFRVLLFKPPCNRMQYVCQQNCICKTHVLRVLLFQFVMDQVDIFCYLSDRKIQNEKQLQTSFTILRLYLSLIVLSQKIQKHVVSKIISLMYSLYSTSKLLGQLLQLNQKCRSILAM